MTPQQRDCIVSKLKSLKKNEESIMDTFSRIVDTSQNKETKLSEAFKSALNMVSRLFKDLFQVEKRNRELEKYLEYYLANQVMIDFIYNILLQNKDGSKKIELNLPFRH